MVDLVYDDIELHVDVQPRFQDKVYYASSVDVDVKPDSGFDVMNSVEIIPVLEEKIVNVHENGSVVVVKSNGYSGMSKVTVNSDVNREKRPLLEKFVFKLRFRADTGSDHDEFFSPADFSTVSQSSLVLLHQKENGNYWFTSEVYVPEDPGVIVMGNNLFYFQTVPGYRTYFFICFYSDPYYDRCYIVSDQWYTEDMRFIDFTEPNSPSASNVEFLGGFVMKVNGSSRNEIWVNLKDYPYDAAVEYERFLSFVWGEYYAQRYLNTYTSFLLRFCNYERFRSKFIDLRNSN